MSWDDAWRLVNAILAGTAGVLVLRSILTKWRHWTPRMRLLAQGLLALLAVVVLGSVENIISDNPIGLRTGCTTAACAWIVFAIAGTPGGYEENDR